MCNFLNKIFNFSSWNWDAISTIVLAITFVVIAIQAWATRKFTKFSVMPSASFFLRSARTMYNRANNRSDLEFPKSIPLEQKLKTLLIIRNNSRFPILFRVKIKLEIDGKRPIFLEEFWKKSLPANFEITRYPNVIDLNKYLSEKDDVGDKKVIAQIKYSYSPEFAPEIKSKTFSQTWTFDLNTYEWRGPAGIEDINISLPGEEEIKK